MGLKSFLIFWLFVLLTFRAKVSGSLDDLESSSRVQIHEQCRFTRYPSHCIQTLLGLGFGLEEPKNVHGVVFSMVEKIRHETLMLPPRPTNLSYQVEFIQGKHAHASIGYCGELMEMSIKHLDKSLLALKDSPKKRKQDIQTWLSTVLTFQHSCKDSVNGLSGVQVDEIRDKIDYLTRLASNSLALVNRINVEPSGSTSSPTRHLLSEDSFPQWVSMEGRKLLQATSPIRANAVVAKDGTGNYATVSEAINAASGGRFVIHVKAGVYKEKIHTNTDGITLIGDGKYSTIITNDDSVKGGSTMPGSATFAVTGDGFMARDIGFQNTAGPQGEQALALRISSDRSVLYRCSLVGYQDTLYAHAQRQFYRECDIYGTIDFIFGNAAAIFQNSNIVLRRPSGGGINAILAQGREDPGQNTGFSLQRCKITPSPDLSPVKHSVKSFLGRPWKKYSRSVVMQSTIDDVIRPTGWVEWEGSFALSTLYFAEYLNSGPGAGAAGRVKWSQTIGPDEAIKFTVGRFIGGTTWLPSTGVVFNAGLE